MLVRATRDGERDGAELVRNLDGRQAHTTRRSGDQDMVPRSHRGLLDQRPVGGGEQRRRGRGGREVHCRWFGIEVSFRADDVLGIAVAHDGVVDPVYLLADGPRGDASTDCVDDAGH